LFHGIRYNSAMKHFVYAGTFGEPEVFNAIAGKPVKHEYDTLHGFGVAVQRPELAPSEVRKVLSENWGDGYYGAFTLVRRNGRNAQVSVFHVEDEDVDRVRQRLAEWNLHNEGWFEFASFRAPAGRQQLEFETDVIKDEYSLRRPSRDYKRDPSYREFVSEMAARLRKIYPQEPEGQVSSPEGQPRRGPERF
jgi:hypothetical protein